MIGADLLTQELKHHGVDRVFTLCGNGLFTFYSSCNKAEIRLIDFRNEQAAAYAADTYARLTGHIGLVTVSSGVAHCNALTGIANAYFDGAPVMLITGASPGYGGGKGVFQEFDQVGLAKPICKYAASVDHVRDLSFKIKAAFAAAISGSPGPVHLTIPEDVLDEKVERPPSHKSINKKKVLGGTNPDQIDKVTKLLKASKHPILIAGTNLFYARTSSSMISFCESASIPIVVPIWDRGVIEKPHPNFLGVVGAASGQPNLLPDADLIILAGTRVDYRINYLTPPAIRKDVNIVRIDIDPHQLQQGIQPTIGILANPTIVFNQLLKKIQGHSDFIHKEWLEETQKRWRQFQSTMTGPPSKEGHMTGRHIIEAVKPLLTDEVIFLIDGGNIGQWAHMLSDRYPSNWLTCGASAVVGWGLGGAMGAKIAFPDRPVLLLSGDGAFGFNLGELESATRQGLTFVAVVAVDEAWGIVVTTQQRDYGEDGILASKFDTSKTVRYDQVAKALGANGALAENPKELRSAILQGFSDKRPTIIHVPIQIGGPADRNKY